jgi:hypothetical protein
MPSPAAQARQATPSQSSIPAAARQGTASKYVAILGFSMTIAAVTAAIASLEWRDDPQPAAVATQVALQQVALQSAPAFQAQPAAQPAPVPAPAKVEPIVAPPLPPPLPAYAPVPPPPLPAYAPAPPPAQPKQCSLPQRKFYVAGNGVIRIHAGDYVSETVALGPYAQVVAIPASRPAPGETAVDTIVVEGRANTVIMTTDLPSFRRVYTNLRGSTSFSVQWVPLREC